MKTSHAIISLSVVLTCVTLMAQEPGTPSAPQTPAAGPQMVETRDVRYATATGVDANLQSLDIHAPEGAKNAPVIVGFHGGGWRGGDKRSFGRLAQPFVAAGYVFVSGNYRLAPAAMQPALVEDVAVALAWVHDHIAEHGGDPRHIFVTGHSAGAHLAALVAVDDRHLKKAGKDLSTLKGAVLLDAAGYDRAAYLASPEATAGMTELIHQTFGKTEAGWRDGSPVSRMAYNDMTPATDPATGRPVQLVSGWFKPAGREETSELGRSAWYLVVEADGKVRLGRVFDPANPLSEAEFGLRCTRSIRPSPFPEDAGRVWYFCGFDQTPVSGRGTAAKGDTAWIYKGTITTKP